MGMQASRTINWDFDGRRIHWVQLEHCLLLVGYDEHYIFNDPQSYSARTYYNKAAVETAYKVQSRQAIVITHKEEQPPIPDYVQPPIPKVPDDAIPMKTLINDLKLLEAFAFSFITTEEGTLEEFVDKVYLAKKVTNFLRSQVYVGMGVVFHHSRQR